MEGSGSEVTSMGGMTKGAATWVFLLAVVVLTVYANCAQNGFVWDDEQFIQKNAYLSSWQLLPKLLTRNIVEGAGITSNLYRPLQSLTHFIDARLWGVSVATGHHVTNIGFHLAMSVALFFLLCRLFPVVAAFLATAFFSLHPLQSEAVGYLSGRGDTMAILFLCLGLLAFHRSVWLALLFAALGVLSKEHLVLFPVFLLLFEYAGGKKIDWRRHAPFWGLSVGYTVLRLTVLNFQNTLNFYMRANEFTEHFSYRLFTYFTTVVKGWTLWILPMDLHHERSWPVYSSLFMPKVAAAFCIVLAIFYTAFALRKVNRAIAVGIVWFFVATFPTSNLVVLINAIFYDHWFILPGLGFVFIIGGMLGTLPDSWKRPVNVVCALGLAALGCVTVQNNLVWKSPESLYSHILKFEPNSGKINSNLGMALSDAGKTEEAILYYKRAIEISDEYPQTHHNLAMAYLAMGREEDALGEFLAAVAIDPRFHHSWEDLGVLYLKSGDTVAAENAFMKALDAYIYSPQPYLGIAEVCRLRSDRRGAIRILQKGVETIPADPQLRIALQNARS